ncbi:LuxR C-terminal-related transcriptional regulator [Streptomyces sp. VNUA24]|uniref:LuxR C-terminal-related transcriptional regulator n=1 Tax=Streptomyces sp. VNUA24 TaxID=3031131 RepID=UPI0023B7C738|nr:LuxR C-terminal-related transcriptional regulator [Streptomyces sp. VNUA24]WEH13786.1 LuxR C-terminal-related transcriptional regulator [Streptomyces sp. VNUA24]
MSTPAVSAREAEVLALLGEHLSNAEISARLFISVRTVESHVSALLRKLGEPDRRALSRRAADTARTERPRPTPSLPVPLTAFVGRARERAELAEAVKTRRQVTAVGPGGVGKTRLALAVAADAAGDFADGVWFVDLAPVTDPARVGAAIAAAVGVGEQPGRGVDASVLTALADRQALLVLDNCEQIRDGVAPFLERLLVACPGLRVLATSRARMLVPFEWVFPVPPLSWDGGAESDAVTLFLERAAAVGRPPEPAVRDRIAAVCERLDGMALAIELAAARWPTLGLDGLIAGLSDQLRILSGGPRAEDRHRSVRAALDWSHELLEPPDRALLRRISVFVVPFTAEAAATVAAFAPLDASAITDGLGRLAEQSLLTATPTATGTRYQALETIRQYGTERLADAAELSDVRSRHLDWCLAGAAALTGTDDADWRARFDALADELRAALARAADRPEHRRKAHRLALALAGLTFTRNLPGESQQRYEQAAALASDAGAEDAVAPAAAKAGERAGAAAAAEALRQAAAVAGCRRLGDDMFRLHRAAAEAAAKAGDTAGAACELAAAATVAYRFSSEFARLPSVDEVTALLTRAHRQLSATADHAPDKKADLPPGAGADVPGGVPAAGDGPSAVVAADVSGAVGGEAAPSAGPVFVSSATAGLAPDAEVDLPPDVGADVPVGASAAGADVPGGVPAAGDGPSAVVAADVSGAVGGEAAPSAGPVFVSSAAAGLAPDAEVDLPPDAGADVPVGAFAAGGDVPVGAPAAGGEPSAVVAADVSGAVDGEADPVFVSSAAAAAAAVAALALAEAAVVADAFGAVQGDVDNTAQETVGHAERAVGLARRAGDPVAESAALDALSGALTWAGDSFGAAAAARRRIEVLAPVPPTPARTHERMDALAMAAGTALGVGRLPEARRWARQLADQHLFAEVQHHARSWLLVVDAFAGHAGDVLTGSEVFLDAWRRSDRKRSFSLGPAAASVALIHGLCGDHEARETWLGIVTQAGTAAEHHHGYGAVFDAMVLLHHGDPEAALRRLAPAPDEVWKWVSWIWLHWYVGLRAEASVLTGHPEARDRVAAARTLVAGNPVVTAQLDRAQALLDGDLPHRTILAKAFDAADCPYQSARTLLLAGGGHTAAGTTALARLGLAPGS